MKWHKLDRQAWRLILQVTAWNAFVYLLLHGFFRAKWWADLKAVLFG